MTPGAGPDLSLAPPRAAGIGYGAGVTGFLMRATWLLLLSPTGCVLDQNLTGKEEDPAPFDTGDTYTTPETDTSTTQIETGETADPPPECGDQSFAGYALAPLENCEVPTAHPAWELVEKWSAAASTMYLSAPSIGQLTDDNGNGRIDDGDTPDVVVAPYTGFIAAYNGADGTLLWSTTSGDIEQTTPAVADLDGDGFPEVVVGGLYGSVALHGEDGSNFWSGSGPGTVKSYCGGIGIADLEADGDPEVYFGAEIFDGQSGSVKASGRAGVGTGIAGESPMSIAADLDMDGYQEVLVGNAAYNYDGDTVWSTGAGDGFAAPFNADGDPEAEVVVANTQGLFLYDDDASEIWNLPMNGSGSYNGPPMIADVDGDGEPEIAIPTANGVRLYEADGTEMWTYAAGSGGFYNGASAYDLDGDGDWEILVNGANSLLVFEGATGNLLIEWPHEQSYPCGQAPTVADLDNDGHVEIAVNVYAQGSGSGLPGSGTYVLQDADNDFVLGRQTWHQHDYYITNIDDDQTVPAVPDTNWLDYNNFRAGPPIDAVAPSANVVVQVADVCTVECNRNTIVVWYQVGNDSTEVIDEDLPLTIYGDTDAGEVVLWEGVWSADLDPAWMAGAESVEITGVPFPLYDVRIAVDGGNDAPSDELRECVESDNENIWGALVCV